MEKYTIEKVSPTGKQSPMYGTEYHVKFVENEGHFKLWYKSAPTEGQVQEGTIDGWKFKKAKKEFNPDNQESTQETTSAPKPTASRAPYKDNSDGMRQGMCFNNASQYVLNVSPEPLAPAEWAKAVNAYAQALYLVSELSKEPIEVEAPKTKVVTIAEAPKSVQDVFGASPANK